MSQFKQQVLQWSLNCVHFHRALQDLSDDLFHCDLPRRQATKIQQIKSIFNRQCPTTDDWDDGCACVVDSKLTDFVADMLQHISEKIPLFSEWTHQDIDNIWILFAKCINKTQYNKCRILVGCILLVLKWDYDQCSKIATKIFWPCIPLPLKLRLGMRDLGFLESHVFLHHLNARLFLL